MLSEERERLSRTGSILSPQVQVLMCGGPTGPGSDVWQTHSLILLEGVRIVTEDLTPIFSLSCLLRSRSCPCPPLAVIGPWF